MAAHPRRVLFGITIGPIHRPPSVVWVPATVAAAATVLPMVYLVIRTAGAGEEALELLLRQRTLWVTLQTLALALVVTVAATGVALPLAWLTVRTDLPLRHMWSVLTVLPLVIPSYVGGLIIVSALGPRGIFQQLLEGSLGIQRLPDLHGFPGAALALTLFTYPYILLSLRAALWRLDPALEETSRSLGVGPWPTFMKVVLPQLFPAMGAGGLLVALYTLHDFGAVSLLRFESLTQQIYVQYEASISRHLAAVFSLLLAALTVTVLLVEARFRSRARYYRTTGGATRPVVTVRLDGWKLPSLIYCAAVVGAGLVLPVSVLTFWLLRGLAAGEPLALLWRSAWNSVYVSTLAVATALVAALPVAVLAVRFPGWIAASVERATYLGFALPGIVVALALVFFGANYAPLIYQTQAMLVFAYLVLFLPQAVGAVRASLLQISPHLEETARSLGMSPLRVLLTVSVPLLRPGLGAGAALVFLATMKELPATLLLSPIGFQSLATRIWSATADGFFARAAAPSLILILAAALPLIWLLRREGEVRP